MDKWHGKVAFITGAAGGIGKVIASKLTNYGIKVIGCDTNLEKLNQLAMEVEKAGKGEFFPRICNLRKESEVLELFQSIQKEFGAIHICVNCAGVGHWASLLNGSTEHWRDMLEVNVLALSIVTTEAISLMRSSGVDDGHIINLNSMSGHQFTPTSMYCATKFAVTALTECLRKELREENSRIRVTGISPGSVKTEFIERLHRDNPKKEDHTASVEYLQADNIAAAVIYALSSPSHVDVNDIFMLAVGQHY